MLVEPKRPIIVYVTKYLFFRILCNISIFQSKMLVSLVLQLVCAFSILFSSNCITDMWTVEYRGRKYIPFVVFPFYVRDVLEFSALKYSKLLKDFVLCQSKLINVLK
jgi:hypothetical protein